MARLIQNEIKRVLADEILFGKLQNGGKVEVDESEGQLIFSYSDAERSTSVTAGASRRHFPGQSDFTPVMEQLIVSPVSDLFRTRFPN